MEQSIRKYVKLNVRFLRILGIWPKTRTFFASKTYAVYHLITIGMLMGLFNLSTFLYLFTVLDQFQVLISSSYNVLMASVANLKAICLVRNWSLMVGLNQVLDSPEFQPRTEGQWERARRRFRMYEIVYRVQIVMVAGLYLVWTVDPLLDYFNNGRMRLIFDGAWFPFDRYRGPVTYGFLFVHQFCGLFFVGFGNINMDLILASYMVCIAVECDILWDMILNVDVFTNKDRPGISSAIHDKDAFVKGMEDHLLKCVVFHRKILEYAEGVAKVFNTTMFIQFAASTISICFGLFQMSVLKPTTVEFLGVLIYVGACLIELLIYCWFGNEVIIQSMKISNALYESEWIDCSPTFKKHLQFFMLRTQKPIQIFAVDFFVLSVATFTSILRASWSTFAVLRQVNNK